MNKELLNRYLVDKELDLLEAMKQMDQNQIAVLFVINENEELIGSLTNGDIRGRLMNVGNLYATVEDVMNTSPKYFLENENSDMLAFFEKAKVVTGIPIVDEKKRIKDIVFRLEIDEREKEIRKTKLSGVPVVIMAGGKGTRLYPYTKILPKPLIPIGDIPIVERIIKRFEDFGVVNYYMTVNYKKEMIKAYFSELKCRYQVHYVEEDKPLGTGGSLRLIESKFDKPIVITNCDILIDADYSDIYRHHQISGNAMTIVSALKKMVVPYGVLETNNQGVITGMEEKPQHSFFINTGMYIINPEVIEKIPDDTFFHMTHLAEKLMNEGLQVGIYPIKEDAFLDMGEFEEMRKMEEKLLEKAE